MTQSVRGYRGKVGEVRQRSELYLSSAPIDQHARAFIKVTLRHGTDHEFPHARQCYYSYAASGQGWPLLQVWPGRKTCARPARDLRKQKIKSIDYIWNGLDSDKCPWGSDGFLDRGVTTGLRP